MNPTSPFINSELGDIRWVPFYNNSGETIPPWGIIQSLDRGKNDVWGYFLNCTISDVYGAQFAHYVNGPTPVLASSYGVCSNCWPLPVLIDETAGAIASGDIVGPRANSFYVHAETGGFRALGPKENGAIWIEPRPMLFMKVKTTSATNKGFYASNLRIMWGAEGSEVEVSGQTLSAAFNRYADIPDDTIGQVKLNDDTGNWEFINANVCL